MANIKKDNKLEKIYTPHKITDYLVSLLQHHYKGEVEVILEPSAGAGDMVDRIRYHYQRTFIEAIDIKNESGRSDIREMDFLKNDLSYLQGRVCIMNPPFHKALKMIYKALEISDYVVSITGSNAFLNIDYNKYDVDEIVYVKKATFLDGKAYPINIICIKNKV